MIDIIQFTFPELSLASRRLKNLYKWPGTEKKMKAV
jgi:hypothetical protein